MTTVLWEHSVAPRGTVELEMHDDAGQEVIRVTAYGPWTYEGENLVPNPSIEEGGDPPPGWTPYKDGGTPTLQVGQVAVAGIRSLQIIGANPNDKARWFTGRDLPVEPGETYILSGWMIGEIQAGGAYICLNWWDKDLKHLSTQYAQPQLAAGEHVGGWIKAGPNEFVAPANAAYARVECRAWDSLVGEVWFDRLHFGPKPNRDETMMARAEAEQLIQFNPAASLQAWMFAHDYVPNSGEFDQEFEGVMYRGQRGEHLGTGDVVVLYCEVGKWDTIYVYHRPTGD